MCSVGAAQVGIALYSAYYQKEVIESKGEYESGVAKYNKRVTENKAQKERAAGVEAENIQRRQTAELLAKQRAQLGAANVSLDTGSALQLQEDTIALGEADALRIRSTTEYRTESLLTQATLLQSDADNARIASENAATGSLLTSSASFLQSGVADKWFTPSSSANKTGGT